MGNKINPISNRLGIINGWDSNWYGGRNYADKIVEDNKIMGLEPKYFYGGLILLAIVGGYMLKTRNTKAKIK